MDMDSAIKILKTFFAGITAASTAIDIWKKLRSKSDAAKAFQETYYKSLESGEAEKAAEEILKAIPADIIETLENRAGKCWLGYKEVLDSERYLPNEVDSATEAVQACVCRELNRLFRLTGSIPPKWQYQWNRYNCKSRDKSIQHEMTEGQAALIQSRYDPV